MYNWVNYEEYLCRKEEGTKKQLNVKIVELGVTTLFRGIFHKAMTLDFGIFIPNSVFEANKIK